MVDVKMDYELNMDEIKMRTRELTDKRKWMFQRTSPRKC